jgi:hypothetical protein
VLTSAPCRFQDDDFSTIPDIALPPLLTFDESFHSALMIQPDVDKNIMPDGSSLLAEALHAETILPSINGDHDSPPAGPESPEDKGIIRCTVRCLPG